MRSDAVVSTILSGVALATILAMTSACSSEPTPPFPKGTGQAKAEAEYPAGPYGVGENSTIANYNFVGYADAKRDTSVMQAIQLADFFNPHGRDATYQPASAAEDDRFFPADSQYAVGAAGPVAKPTVLLIDVASVWCAPCNFEAANVLPALHASYAPCGGEFLLQLADSATPGTTATPKDLFRWTTKYKVDYPSSLDPRYRLGALFKMDAYPTNIIVDTTTMKIVKIVAGATFAKACEEAMECKTDSDCAKCFAQPGVCGDGQTTCTTDADCSASSTTCTTTSLCGNGRTTCTTDADCAALTCTTTQFWTAYEALLDKSRAGCSVQ